MFLKLRFTLLFLVLGIAPKLVKGDDDLLLLTVPAIIAAATSNETDNIRPTISVTEEVRIRGVTVVYTTSDIDGTIRNVKLFEDGMLTSNINPVATRGEFPTTYTGQFIGRSGHTYSIRSTDDDGDSTTLNGIF